MKELFTYSNDLNFHPHLSWPQNLPSFSWNNYLLCGFHEKEKPASSRIIEIKNSQNNLLEILPRIYPQLNLAELARLYYKLERHKDHLDISDLICWKSFFQHYHLHYCEKLKITLKTITQTPLQFQNWIDQKKVTPKDLSSLTSCFQWKNNPLFFNRFLAFNPSRQEGTQILELLLEFLEMNHSLHDLPTNHTNTSAWLSSLKEKRYPLSSTKDAKNSHKVKQILWPSFVSAQWKRQGDETGIEIKFFALSQKDFSKKIKNLERFTKYWPT